MFSTIIIALLALVLVGILVVALYIGIQGDAEMRLLPEKRTAVTKDSESAKRLDFSLEVPFDNIGKEEGTIIDTYMRIYLPEEQYDDVLLRGKVNLKGVLRGDDYFEALLVPAGTGNNLVLRFEAYAKNGKTIAEAMKNIPDVDVALYIDCRGRRELFTVKRYLTLTAEEMRALVK